MLSHIAIQSATQIVNLGQFVKQLQQGSDRTIREACACRTLVGQGIAHRITIQHGISYTRPLVTQSFYAPVTILVHQA